MKVKAIRLSILYMWKNETRFYILRNESYTGRWFAVTKFKLLIVFLPILLVFIGCNNNPRDPIVMLSIKYEKFLGDSDDQLYKLYDNGKLEVTLCRLKTAGSYEIADFYDQNSNWKPCKFKKKTYYITKKQQSDIEKMVEKLESTEMVKPGPPIIESNSNFATVFIKTGNRASYSCRYTEDYSVDQQANLYSPEVLDIAYRFIELAPIKAREKWIFRGPNDPPEGRTILVNGVTTHSHSWNVEDNAVARGG